VLAVRTYATIIADLGGFVNDPDSSRVIDILGRVRYNTVLKEHTMSEAKAALYSALLQLQALTDLDDDRMQTAISVLAQTIEDHVA
jgi:hypothetical protein